MRNLIYLLIFSPVVVFAQKQPGIPPNMPMDMEKMQRNMQQIDMGKMQEAMECMKNIDRSALEGLKEEGEKMKAEVGSLCKSGKRDEAQDKAIVYGKEMMSRPELMKMRRCGKMMAGMMPEMPFEHIEEEAKNSHVCDGY
jgi:hypothetical protein